MNPLIPGLSNRMPVASPWAFLGICGAEGCRSGLRSWSPEPLYVPVLHLHQLWQVTRRFFLGLFKVYPCCVVGNGAWYLLLLVHTKIPFLMDTIARLHWEVPRADRAPQWTCWELKGKKIPPFPSVSSALPTPSHAVICASCTEGEEGMGGVEAIWNGGVVSYTVLSCESHKRQCGPPAYDLIHFLNAWDGYCWTPLWLLFSLVVFYRLFFLRGATDTDSTATAQCCYSPRAAELLHPDKGTSDSTLQFFSLLCSDTDIQLLFVLGKAEGNIASDYLIDLLRIQEKVPLKHFSRL